MSTDVDRCLMTAQAVLAGLYPPEGVHGGNEDLPWQPVPVHTTPKRSDQVSRSGTIIFFPDVSKTGTSGDGAVCYTW